MNTQSPDTDHDDQYASFEIAPSGIVVYDTNNPSAWIACDSTWTNEP